MEEFFTKIVNTLPVILVALPAGWLGSWLQSYFSEKGKNLATKEDIEEITRKIELTKNRSSALIERKILAYEEISKELSELQIYCFRELNKPNEHAVPYTEIPFKSSFQRAMEMRELIFRHQVFIEEDIIQKIKSLSDAIYSLGQVELFSSQSEYAKQIASIDQNFYTDILNDCKVVLNGMYENLYDGK